MNSDQFDLNHSVATEFDRDQLEHFRRYLHGNYYDRFRPALGTEQILDTLARFSRGGKWIDLGAGPTTLFWSLALSDIDIITCNDIAPEALIVLREFVESEDVPQCYMDALSRLTRPPSHLSEMRQRVQHYYIFDTMAPWPAALHDHRYDLITALGTFGLAPSAERYVQCFAHLKSHLSPGGRAIGANWRRSPALVKAQGGDNSYLSPKLIWAAAEQYDLNVQRASWEPIADDPSYDGVLIWALADNDSNHA